MSNDDFGTRLEPAAPTTFEPIRGNFQTGLPQPPATPGYLPQSGILTFNPNTTQPEPIAPPMKIKPTPGSAQAMLARAEEIARSRQQELGRKYFALIDASVRRELGDDEVVELERLGRATSLDRFMDSYLQHARESLAAERLLSTTPDNATRLQELDAQMAQIDAELQELFKKLNERSAPIQAARDAVQRDQLARISAEQTMQSWHEILTCERGEIPLVEHRGAYDVLHPRNEMGR